MDQVLKSMTAVLTDYYEHGLLALSLLQTGDWDAADQVLSQRGLLFEEFNRKADEAGEAGIPWSEEPSLRQLWDLIRGSDAKLATALRGSCESLSREALLLKKARHTIQSYKSGQEDDSSIYRRV